MNKIFQLLIFVLLLPMLAACDHGSQEQTESTSTPKIAIATQPDRMDCKVGDDPYACQRIACHNANATYHEAIHLCECKPDTIFWAIQGGACLEARPLENQVFDFQFSETKHYYVRNRQNAFDGEELSALVSHRSVPVFGGRRQLVLVKDSEQLAALSDGFDQDFFNLGLPNTELDYYDLNSGYADRMSRSTLQFLMVPSGRPLVLKDAEANKRLMLALDALEQTAPKPSVESFSELGCAEICIERSELLNNSNFIAYHLRVFSGGNPLQDTLNIFNKSSQEVETMVVFVGRKPSHYFASTHLGGYDVYGNDGTLIKTVSKQLEVSKLKPISPDSALARSTPVAIFEGDYSENVDSVAYIGPHQDSAFYGWFTASDNRPYFYGKTTTLLGEEAIGNAGHSAIVSTLASDGFTKRLLPMAVTSLQSDDFLKVLNRIDQPKIAANISFAFTFTPEICRKSALAHTIQLSQGRVLWTIGAGNSGSEIDQHSLPFCPQALEEKNLLIVAATNGNQSLSRASSFGENYADIAANGCGLLSQSCNDGATSFASPRVARIAADLIEKFPTLSIEQIKLALISTVQVPDTGFRHLPKYLNVKSGGVIDPVAAQNFISLLLETPSFDLQNLDFNSISAQQVNTLKFVLKKSRQHQFKNFTPQQADTFLNDHINRLLNKYGSHQ